MYFLPTDVKMKQFWVTRCTDVFWDVKKIFFWMLKILKEIPTPKFLEIYFLETETLKWLLVHIIQNTEIQQGRPDL